MIDQLLINEIGDALEMEVPGTFIGRMHTNADVTLPAILLQLEGESVVGSPLYRGTLQAMVVSAAAETSSTEHGELCAVVDQAIRAMEVSVPPALSLYGIVPTTTAADTDGNQYRTTLSYTVGYGPTS